MPESRFEQWRLFGRRTIYEDRDARISSLAGAEAHRPDTLMQTDQIGSRTLLAAGRAIRCSKLHASAPWTTGVIAGDIRGSSPIYLGAHSDTFSRVGSRTLGCRLSLAGEHLRRAGANHGAIRVFRSPDLRELSSLRGITLGKDEPINPLNPSSNRRTFVPRVRLGLTFRQSETGIAGAPAGIEPCRDIAHSVGTVGQ